MDKYLVTGAAGFIGSEISKSLLKSGYLVCGIDSLDSLLYDKKVKEQRLSYLINFKNFSFIEGSLNKLDLNLLLRDVDFVINEAGLPGQLLSWDNIDSYYLANTIAVGKLFKAAINNSVKVFIQASTSSVYGEQAIGNEENVPNPSSPYGASKYAAENLIKILQESNKMKTIILRYFSVYGPGQRPDMGIYKFCNSILKREKLKIFGDGNQTRDFTFISDIVNATLTSIERGMNAETYNVSGGEQVSINELIKMLEIISGFQAEISYVEKPQGDQVHTFADTSKIRRHLNWKPEINLEKGLVQQFAWHEHNK